MPTLQSSIAQRFASVRKRLPMWASMAPDDGALMLASVLGPVLVGWLLAKSDQVPLAVYGAFQVSLVNVQGLYRDRSRTKLLTLLMLLLVMVWLNAIQGHAVLEFVSMFVFMLFVGRAAAFSPTAISLGLASAVAYIVIGALHADLGWGETLAKALGQVGMGGLWAVSIHYLYWALRPTTPLALKVGEVYGTLASVVERNINSENQWLALPEFEAVDSALGQARSLWSSARNYRHGSSPRHLQLLSLIESSDLIKEKLLLVVESLSYTWNSTYLHPTRPLVLKALKELASCLRDVPNALSPRRKPLTFEVLDTTLEQLDAVREKLRLRALESDLEDDRDEKITALVNLRGVVESLQKIASELEQASKLACNLLPRPFWDRFWKTSPISDWTWSPRRRKAVGLRSLRALKAWSSLDRHAVRFAIVVVLGAQVGRLPLFEHGYWVPLHIALVLRPDYGSTATRSLERTSGTVWGSLFGIGVLALTPAPTLLWGLLLLLLFTALTVRPASYSWFVALITPAVLLLLELISHEGWGAGIDRIASTVAGVTLALLGVAFLFPQWERRGFDVQLERTLRSHLLLFRRVTKGYLSPNRPQVTGRSGALRFQVSNDIAELGAAAKRATQMPRQLRPPSKLLRALVFQSQKLTTSITALAYYQSQFGWRYHTEEFARYCDEVSSALTELADSLQENRCPQSFPTLNDVLKELGLRVHELQRERGAEYAHQPSRETLLAKAVREQTPVFTQLERIAEELVEMQTKLSELHQAQQGLPTQHNGVAPPKS